jgi:hypothetical protein
MSTTEGIAMTAPTTEYDVLMVQAHNLGAEHGRAAASWYFDGNTTTEQYERALQMIEDGDPAVYDTFPTSPLSGEYAGDPLPSDVLVELELDHEDDAADDALAMYEDGFGVAVADTIERMAREHLAGDATSEFGLRRLAREMSGRFTRRTREDGTSYTTLTDESPEWMRDVVYDAHAGMFPDDHRYDLIAAAVEHIADRADWDDSQHEFADSQVSVYDHDVVEWFASHGARRDYCEQANDDYGPSDGTIVEAMQRGQYVEACEVIARVAFVLEGLSESTLEAS